VSVKDVFDVKCFQEEHEKIMERRVESDSDIAWEEYKSMKFTSHVCAIYRIVKNKQKLSNVSLVHGRIQSNSYLAPDILSTSHIGYT